MTTITATYSPEDNKLRLYASTRLDTATYERVKAAGFGWAPKQQLFVAPKWTPAREDLALELAGEIEPEEMTLAERAANKAERLDNLAHKRHREANAFQRAAQELSECFSGGQPILVGHHSERRARKTQEKMHNAMDKAVAASKASNYWLYRAEGVERFANMKNNPRVRVGRIKALLAELRDLQRDLNHADLRLKVWEKITTDDAIKLAVGRSIPSGELSPWTLWSELRDGKVTPQEARAKSIEAAQRVLSSDTHKRWIDHILNRLSYERELLGSVQRFEGELTPVILQAFAREHGAHKPEGKKLDSDLFALESAAMLPMHLSTSRYMELSGDEWRDLMQSVGYEVPEKGEALPPILNLKVPTLFGLSPWRRGEIEIFPVREMAKAEYSKIANDYRGTRTSPCGLYRFKICSIRKPGKEFFDRERVAVLLTDSKIHPIPESYTVLAAKLAPQPEAAQ